MKRNRIDPNAEDTVIRSPSTTIIIIELLIGLFVLSVGIFVQRPINHAPKTAVTESLFRTWREIQSGEFRRVELPIRRTTCQMLAIHYVIKWNCKQISWAKKRLSIGVNWSRKKFCLRLEVVCKAVHAISCFLFIFPRTINAALLQIITLFCKATWVSRHIYVKKVR